jgi:hypothetical protein
MDCCLCKCERAEFRICRSLYAQQKIVARGGDVSTNLAVQCIEYQESYFSKHVFAFNNRHVLCNLCMEDQFTLAKDAASCQCNCDMTGIITDKPMCFLRRGILEQWKRRHVRYLGIPPKIPFESLNAKQKYVIRLVQQQINRPYPDFYLNPLKLIVYGGPGVGKSAVIEHLRYLLELKQQRGPAFSFRLCAYTGVASHSIGGTTCHKAFAIEPFSTKTYLEMLQRQFSTAMLTDFRLIRVIVVDEFGMCGLKLLQYIDRLMRQVDPERSHINFAGR